MKNHLFLFLLVFCMGMAGCAPIYLPSSPNTPMLTKKGDVHVALRAGITGAELQAAYALDNHYYLFAGIISSEEEQDNEPEPSRHRYGEFGGGYIWRTPPASIANFTGIIEASGGLGIGSGTGRARWHIGESVHTIHSEGSYLKPFLQTNLAVQSNVFDFGFVNRLALIQFSEIRELGGNSTQINQNPSSPIFWEPSLFTQLGWKRFKINLHAGLSGPLSGEPDFRHRTMNISLGLNYRIGTGKE